MTEDNEDIKWATMIPLIGGSALGCQKATGSMPSYHLSYTPFSKNEAHLKKHWPDVPMFYLDELPKRIELGNEDIDFVNSVCPCAGLSMLNVSKTGQSARGADAVQNDWMLKSAKFVLSSIKPKCLWGENAPGLFDNPGRDLVEKLRAIANEYSYSFSLVKTNSELHGLPQRRMRTFYFFWKSPVVPMLQWKETEAKPLAEYLQDIPEWATFQDQFVHEGKASERYRPYQYVLEREGLSHAEFYKKNGRGTVAKYLEKHGLIDECINWLQYYYPTETFSISGTGKCRTHIDVLEHMKRKLSQGLGYWDDSLKFMGHAFTAVISKNIEYAVHPTEDRFFSIRELLHLMGMPHDYQIDRKQNINHVCQNVPVNTAKDWADEVVKFCQGKAEMTNYSFMKQDNVTQNLVETYPPQAPEERLAHKRKSVQMKMERKQLKLEVESNVDELFKQEELGVTQEYDDSGYMEGEYVDIKYEEDSIKQEMEDMKPMMNGLDQYQSMSGFEGGVHSFDKPISFFGTKPKAEPLVPAPIVPKVEHLSPLPKTPKVEQQLLPPPIVLEDKEPEPKSTKKFRCGICNMVFNNKSDIETHWKSDCRLVDNQTPRLVDNQTPTYNCGECGFKTKTIDDMKYHWKVRCTRFAAKNNQSIKKPVICQTKIQKENIRNRNLLNNIKLLIENGTIQAGKRL